MSEKKSRFGNIKSRSAVKYDEDINETKSAQILENNEKSKKQSRLGKKAIAGYYSEALSREFHTLAIKEGKTVQALLGEAIDDLLRSRGINPYGER